MNKRLGCLLIPNFPLAVQLRETPELCRKPVILTENETARSKVLYANLQATEEGISKGMTTVQAKNVCPTITVLARDIKKEKQKSEELLREVQKFTPFIEQGKSGTAYLDVSGLTKIYPHEETLGKELISFIKAHGYPVKVGIARNKFTALVAASISQVYSYTIVHSGGEKEFLKEKPIHLLPADQDLQEKFYHLGIKTLGQFSLLQDKEIAERFGPEGLKCLRLSRGEDDEKLKPDRFDVEEIHNIDLDYPLETQIGILFHINSILKKQLSNLCQRGLVCEEVLVDLKTEDRKEIPIHLSLTEGSNQPKTFIDILRLELDKLRITTPIKKIKVIIQRTSPQMPEQLTLYQKKETNSILKIFSQLKRILGNGNILSPQIVSSHRPEEKFKLIPYTPEAKHQSRLEIKKDVRDMAVPAEPGFGFSQKSKFVLRLYNPPIPANVKIDNGSIKYVIASSWYGEVVKQTGPWEISGEWWTQGFDRHYFEIELFEGEQYLIFYENSSGKWFVQGIFD